jgi:glutamate-1-semialdehyde 2,1-aminomutase
VNSPVRAFRSVGGEPFFVSRAEGARIFTVDDRELIDYVGTWGPAILGHAPDVVIAAVCGAASNGLSFGIPNPLEVEMAEMICNLVPSIERVRMVNSGTEATMSCIRLARGFTGRDKIIKFEGCYHGHVDSLLVKAGSGALTHGQPDSAGVPAALANLTIALPFNDLGAVQQALTTNKGEVAAIILEPVPANAGLYLPEPDFLQELRTQCDAQGTLLIFDEVWRISCVPCGAQNSTIMPTLAGKVIEAGFLWALGGRAEIMEKLSPDGPVYQLERFQIVAMAAGLAQVHQLIQQGGGPWRWAKRKAMRPAIDGKPITFHRIGSMFCLYFCEGPIRNLADARRSDQAAFARYFHACLDRGVYFAPSQFEAGFLSLAHTEVDIEQTARVAADAIQAAGY